MKVKLYDLIIGIWLLCLVAVYIQLTTREEPQKIYTSEQQVTHQEESDIEPATLDIVNAEKSYIEKLENVKLSAELQQWTMSYSYERHISPFIVFAIIEKESDYDANAVGDAGESIGLMQIQEKWHQERMKKLGLYDLWDSQQNIQVGIDYLMELLDENPDMEWALNAYNGGRAYADRKKETHTEYATYILTRAAELEKEWWQ